VIHKGSTVDKAVDNEVLLAWDQTLGAVVERIDATDLNDYLLHLQPVSQRGRTLVLEAPSRLATELVQRRYQPLLELELAKASGGSLEAISLRVRRTTQQELFPNPAPKPPAPSGAEAIDSSSLIPKYTFDTFIVGASNQFAHAACKAVANQPGEHYNPLFIYGGVGLGKTHLVNAVGHEILGTNPRARVLYLSSDSFMNELIVGIRKDRMEEFRNRFRRIDVLILDDVQFLAGRERTQEEFFHTFNSLYEGHRQIVLASDKFPKEIPSLEERVRNRFECGLIADIQPPDMETRVAILEKKAELEQIELPHEVALFLASQIDTNVRQLEGSLTRLRAFASLNKCQITVDLAQEILRSLLPDRSSGILTIETIQKTVSEFYKLRPNELRSKKRARSIALPRQIAMYLCRRHTDASFPVIGDRFGGRDHSTVIHAAQAIERRMRDDATLRLAVEHIERLLDRAR
jgi:chromosomal replication initiator protein